MNGANKRVWMPVVGGIFDIVIGNLDPCEHDYEVHFQFSTDGTVGGLSPSALYMVERLHLNRAQIVRLRSRRCQEKAEYQQDLAYGPSATT